MNKIIFLNFTNNKNSFLKKWGIYLMKWEKITKEEYKRIFNSRNTNVIGILKNEKIINDDEKWYVFILKLKYEKGDIFMEKYVLKIEFDPFKGEMVEFKKTC